MRKQSVALKGVTWAGELDRSAVRQLLGSLDVIVMPSRWPENSPNVVLEAQAMGIPVIGARVGGIPELVQHEHNGLLFAAGDAGDLAAQMARLVREPDLRRRLGAAAPDVRSLDDEADDLLATYRTVMAEGARTP